MWTFNKRDKINIAIIIGIILLYVLIMTKCGNLLYGSLYDWDCQHWAFPDYFRKLFYSTGNLFPNFAFNLASGQNIYFFSYYGLLSPIILISYFLPFIKMVDYIQISTILIIIISSILFYKWIRNSSNENISLVSTIIFLCASPILFHSHRHIMFINYMPFLIMGLMGVDKYFKKNSKSLLTISVFLIIMTSYFYSVGAILTIVIYGIYKYIEINNKLTIKSFFKDGMKFLLPIIIGILMSSILILPTFYAILAGRSDTTVSINILKLLIPSLNAEFLFSSYGVGVLSFFVFSVVDAIIKKDIKSKFLGICSSIMLVFPIVIYILNGTMYVDYKVLIPFIPLFVFMISNTLKNIFCDNYNYKKLIIITSIVSLLFFMNKNYYNLELIAQVLLINIFIILSFKLKKKNIILFILSLMSIINCFYICKQDPLFEKSEFNKLMNSELNIMELENNSNFYRTINLNNLLQNSNFVLNTNEYKSSVYSSVSNKELKKFFYNEAGNEVTQRSYGKLTSSRNIFYNILMGNKYYISNGSEIAGYNFVKGDLYKNDDVFSIIYGNKKLMSKNDYDKLKFPYKMEALLNYIIVDKNAENDYKTNIEKIYYDFENAKKENLNILKQDNKYYIDSDNGKLSLELKENKKNIVMIKFKMENNPTCPSSDLTIRINGVKNTLTCSNWKYHNKNYEFKYVISSNEPIKKLEALFSKGNFIISDVEIYQTDYKFLKETKNNIDEFVFDTNNTKNDVIVGKINASYDEYLAMSIPYDKGFNIYVDGKKTNYEKVNLNLIGLEIKKGTHDIKIEYVSPWFKLGKYLTFAGFNLFFIILLIDWSNKTYYKKSLKSKHLK